MSSKVTDLAHTLDVHVLRLLPGKDLKKEIASFVIANDIKAGCILTAVGSLKSVNIRFAGKKDGNKTSGKYEIVSLVGTLDKSGDMHLHISVSDENGQVSGGHLLEENIIRTTGEIIIGSITGVVFIRQFEPLSGYDELVILEDNS
ncbi:Putative DNA-binding protein [Candidatus Trichorickettsia mobilis]|uniref:DNA-binding protein n=1 Tax=Candidatus Trichorickettsia mobilis TaxID=1346319 RepID=A0ABZ0URZ9_9RICK|nr:PPC domain-containing DNA-binding protein [Candidatus Trichorickettsia mobilis]WPY00591.1 Putative DNA-binding protein [Candidatus Trichorickettsia mobilis]